MRTLAQKQDQPSRRISSNRARSNMAASGPNHHTHPVLHLQRTIGNHAVLRMLQTHAEERDVGSTSTAASRFAHGFSPNPLHRMSPGSLQAKRGLGQGKVTFQRSDNRGNSIQ